jgi:hypothetical protein
VVASAGRTQLRHSLLSARVVVHYVMALSLYSQASYEEVMQFLVQGLSWLTHWRKGWQVPTKAAIFKSRQRLGVEPMQELFRITARPLAGSETKGAWYRDWRVMALDGSCLDVADTEANEIAFGRPGSAREGQAAFPQLLVGLAECGTHAIVAAVMGPYGGPERELVRRLLLALQPGMLCLADRGLYSFQLWQQAQAQGAALLWRIHANLRLEVSHRFADGSYLAQPHDSADRRREQGMTVRVIDYVLDDPGRPNSGHYRLLTNLLAPDQALARELAALYAQRWEFKTILDELKIHQRGPRVVLRSKFPEGVYQEALRLPAHSLRHLRPRA